MKKRKAIPRWVRFYGGENPVIDCERCEQSWPLPPGVSRLATILPFLEDWARDHRECKARPKPEGEAK